MNDNDKLADYARKRRFGETPEPPAGGKRRTRAAQALRFVIQKHDARHLHYDFRLELDGTLKSWAIPKGPSLDPDIKRLAVQVEDHPLDYAGFEGTIPEGQYGAGTVIVWDQGTWVPDGDPVAAYAAGKLTFALSGEKLHGGFTLVRSHMRGARDGAQVQWLLLKARDADARPEADWCVTDALPNSAVTGKPLRPHKAASRAATRGMADTALPLTLAPQLATLVDAAPPGADWLFEIKFDGYRLLARLDPGDPDRPVMLMTRNGNDWTDRFPAIAEALGNLKLGACWLDGEAVVLDEQGLPSFQALQNAFETGGGNAIVLYLFDAPFFNGRDLRDMPLSERRALLREALESSVGGVTGPVRWSESFDADPHELLETACSLHLEGIIGKHAQSVYRPGRASSWVKVKCRRRQEFVIGGYTDPAGQRSAFGALLLGVYDDAGALHYAGRVGTGFDRTSLDTIGAKLKRLQTSTSAFVKPPRAAGVHWVEPVLVAECHFGEWTQDNLLRQASFIALREDKPPRTIVRERPKPAADAQADAVSAATAPSEKTAAGVAAQALPKPKRRRKGDAGVAPVVRVKPEKTSPPHRAPDAVAGVRISHPERVIDATTGFTKGQLAEYYASVAAAMLPHLRDRPVSLMRAPDGVAGELFFQRHSAAAAIPHLTQHPKLDPGHPPLLSVDSLDALIGAVQMGTVEFHTWNGLAGNLEKPDRIVFDLDPDPALDWRRMRDAVMLVRTLLDEIGLVSFCKTSGGKGLHVVVPLAPRDGWDAVRDFAQAVARHLATTLPRQFSAKMGPQNRVGKIFVDYLRNNRGASTVAAFSARARPGLGVSIPVAWDEVPDLKGGDQWNVITAPRRLAELTTDPWANYAGVRQRLSAAMRKRLDAAREG